MDPFEQATAPRPSVAAPARAVVMPIRNGQEPFEAELLGRVGNDKIRVRKDAETVFAVHRFRLHAVDKPAGEARRRLSNAEINELPWLGAAPDPLRHHEPAKPWRNR